MTKEAFIGSRPVGPGHPCYVIAEVGTTCLGNLEMALELVEAGATAGVDAVKFQVIDPHQDSRSEQTYGAVVGGEATQLNMREMFSQLQFDVGEWRTIARACANAGVEFLATVDYLAGVDMLEELGMVAHKIGAWDTTYRPLIERIGATGKPMIVDLGPTTQSELDELTTWYLDAGGSAVLFLHDYHTDVMAEVNMRAVTHLIESQPWPVGYSSPNRHETLDYVALGLGASIVEKRLILDRDTVAFHAHESLEPSEFVVWLDRFRAADVALGEPAIRPSTLDTEYSSDYYRSLCTIAPVRAGEPLTTANLDARRPGTGLAPARIGEFLGRTAARDLAVNTLITVDDVA